MRLFLLIAELFAMVCIVVGETNTSLMESLLEGADVPDQEVIKQFIPLDETLTPPVTLSTSTKSSLDNETSDDDQLQSEYISLLTQIQDDADTGINNTVKYFFYHGRNSSEEIPKNFENITNFDPQKGVKLIIHGWMSDRNNDSVVLLKNAYLNTTKYNVFSCEWSAAKDFYYGASHATPAVGAEVGEFLNRLVSKGLTNYSNIHILGHSLGAHVASAAGKLTNGSIARITCLDPAAPCFMKDDSCFINDTSVNISQSDAKFVDVVHTNKGVLGLASPVGTADFYPNNGGPTQPGCEDTTAAFEGLLMHSAACSHFRSYQYFAESIGENKFLAKKCDNWSDFKNNKCGDKQYVMGDGASAQDAGVFYLATHKKSPFAEG